MPAAPNLRAPKRLSPGGFLQAVNVEPLVIVPPYCSL